MCTMYTTGVTYVQHEVENVHVPLIPYGVLQISTYYIHMYIPTKFWCTVLKYIRTYIHMYIRMCTIFLYVSLTTYVGWNYNKIEN